MAGSLLRFCAWGLLFAAPAACTSGTKDDEGGNDDTGVENDPALEPGDIEVEVSDHVKTVLIVRWTTAQETTGYVDFGSDASYGLRTDSTDPGTRHERVLIGMPPDTEVHYRIVVEGESSSFRTQDATASTGSLPSGLPSFSATGETDAWAYQVVPFQGTSFAVTILDPLGNYVWYYEMASGGNLMRAFLSADRQEIVVMHTGDQTALENGEVLRVGLDGRLIETIPMPWIDHDMLELPDGGWALIRVEEREGWMADSIVERSPDGVETEIWNAWDHFNPVALGLEEEENWTHANAIDYLPEDDAYLFGMRELGIAKISRSTGEIQWIMHGILNEFTTIGDTEVVLQNHQFEWLEDDRILVFDNGQVDRGYSRVVEFAVDEEAKTIEQTWEYIRDPSVYVFAKGDVLRFEDGNTEVIWSANGELQEVTPAGEVVWQLNADLGQAITYVQALDGFYARD